MTVSIDDQIAAMVRRCNDWLRRRDEMTQESHEILADTIALAERAKRETPRVSGLIDAALEGLRRNIGGPSK